MATVTLRLRRSLGLVAVAALLAACSGAAASPAPSSQPAATPAAVASADAGASGGPVDFAAWVERQGFGGSSGLNEVAKEAHWMQDHPAEVTPFDMQTTLGFVDHLAGWLDDHQPTACWAEYHATVRETLGRMHDGYTTAIEERSAGKYVTKDLVTAIVADADAAEALPQPPGC